MSTEEIDSQFLVVYTKHKLRKRKLWEDGVLATKVTPQERNGSSTTLVKATLYPCADTMQPKPSGAALDVTSIKLNSSSALEGSSLEFEGYLVSVEHQIPLMTINSNTIPPQQQQQGSPHHTRGTENHEFQIQNTMDRPQVAKKCKVDKTQNDTLSIAWSDDRHPLEPQKPTRTLSQLIHAFGKSTPSAAAK